MQRLGEQFPHYEWANNKGYPTKKHREAIMNYGITEYHRKSFNLIEQQIELAFNEK